MNPVPYYQNKSILSYLFVESPSAKTLRLTKCWVRACATISPHLLYILSYTQMQCYPPLRQLHSDFGDFSDGVCNVVWITIAESKPDLRLLTQQKFCFSPAVLAGYDKMTTKTMWTASDRGQTVSETRLTRWVVDKSQITRLSGDMQSTKLTKSKCM